MSRRITAAYLRSLDACTEQVETFAKLWPNGATVTLPAARRAIAAGLDLGWLAGKRSPAIRRVGIVTRPGQLPEPPERPGPGDGQSESSRGEADEEDGGQQVHVRFPLTPRALGLILGVWRPR